MLFEKILIQSAKQFNGERSPVAIYHLLTGKKSIQTVQDAHIYNLQSFYGILPRLEISFYEKKIKQLKRKELLRISQENFLEITAKGINYLHNLNPLEIRGFAGLKYHQKDSQFMNRLLLFIQILSNSKEGNYNYIPIVDEREYTIWARKIYYEIKSDIQKISLELEGELLTIGARLTKEEMNIFVDRLTGYNIYGKSLDQLSNKYKYKQVDIQLILVRIRHKMMALIYEDMNKYRILARILPEDKKKAFLTNSAAETYKFFRQGNSVEEIAKKRGLRLNTILDHIVEISLYDQDFPYESFLLPQVEEEIFNLLKSHETFKLKEIKKHVNKDISYFEIRLALSKYNQNKDETL